MGMCCCPAHLFVAEGVSRRSAHTFPLSEAPVSVHNDRDMLGNRTGAQGRANEALRKRKRLELPNDLRAHFTL